MGDSSLSHFFTRWTRPSSGDEVFLIENDGGEAATPTQLQPRRSLVTTLALALVGVVLLAGGIGLTTFFLHSPRTNDLHGTSVTTPTPPPETPPAWTRVGKEIQSFMNPDANPCQDFYDVSIKQSHSQILRQIETPSFASLISFVQLIRRHLSLLILTRVTVKTPLSTKTTCLSVHNTITNFDRTITHLSPE